MPTLKTPLIGSYNQRQFTSSYSPDQRFKACIFTRALNPALNSATWYVEKRGGLAPVSAAISAGEYGQACFTSPSLSSAIGQPGNFFAFYTTSLASPFVLFRKPSSGASVNCGSVTSQPVDIIEAVFNGITYILITLVDGTGWYLPSDATTQTAYTGTTHTSTLVDGIANTAGMYSGQLFTGSGTQAGTRIASVNSPNAITLTLATTTSVTASFTKTPIAKIIDADFPVVVGSFAEMDGFIFVMDAAGNIWNSDINTVSSWTAGNFVPADASTDIGVGVLKYQNYIAGCGRNSIQFFYNAGNAAGSPLSVAPQLTINIGVSNSSAIVNNSSGGAAIARVIQNTFYFVADALYRLNGFTPVKITPQPLNVNSTYITRLFGFNYGGQTIIHLERGATDSLWYSTETQTFSEPNLSASAYFDATNYNNLVLGSADSTGKQFVLSISGSYTDNGTPFTMSLQIQTDMGTNDRKWPTELRVNGDTQTSGNLAVSYSDDDGVTFSTPRNIPLTNQRKRLNRLGSFCGRRLWKFEDSGNNPNRISGVEIDYELGSQ